MIMARAVAALAACAAAFERVCPGDQPTNVSDTIFKERVVVFDEAMGARVVVAGDINKDGRNDLVVASSTDNAIRWFIRRDDAKQGCGDATPGVRGRRRRGRALPCLIMLVF